MVQSPKFWQEISSKQKKEVIISVVLIVLVLGGTFGALALVKVFLHTDYPFVVVTSGSMEPTIYRGDILILEGKHDLSKISTISSCFKVERI
jgi:signal peptidase I